MLSGLRRDVIDAFRMLRKRPGFTLAAILTLALSIGANTAIFSVVNAVLLRPLPYSHPERLVGVWTTSRQFGQISVAYPDYLDWRRYNQAFTDLAVYQRHFHNLTGRGDPMRLLGRRVTSNFFSTLGVSPQLGRSFLPQEDQRGAAPAVILSHGFWQRHFNGDPHVLGQAMTLDGQSFTVVGVLAADFEFYQPVDIWVPIGLAEAEIMRRGDHPGIYVVGRLKPGVTLTKARVEMETIARRLAQEYPATNNGDGVALRPLRDDMVGEIKPALLVLMGAVGFVLLIACANLANLLLSRLIEREKEFAIRTALGANRRQLLRQRLTEGIVLTLLGGIVGIFLASSGTGLLESLLPGNLPRVEEVHVDLLVVVFALLISLLTGVAVVLIPTLQHRYVALSQLLADRARGASSGGQGKLRAWLVVTEIALALVLLTGAGLLINSFRRLREVDPGFNSANVLTMKMSLPKSRYPNGASLFNFYQQVTQRLAARSEVRSAALTSYLPLAGGNENSFWLDDRPKPREGDWPTGNIYTVSGDYFRTMGIPLQKGRTFTEQDGPGKPRVAVIDQTFARHFWPDGGEPLGKRLCVDDDAAGLCWEIVGVVGNVKQEGLSEKPRPQFYFPYLQLPDQFAAMIVRDMTLTVATRTDAAAAVGVVRSAVLEVDKNQPVYDVKTMREIVAASIAEQRFSLYLLSLFAVLALVLSIIGIYGVISFSVTQRQREIGIRMALGARRADVLRMVLLQGVKLTAIGIAIGLVGALALTRALTSLLYGIGATDPATFVAVIMVLAAAALAATCLPALRATRVNPLETLRAE